MPASNEFLMQFDEFVRQKHLFDKSDQLLLAFSGGPDSVCLADLLFKFGYSFALVHVNFHLRGSAADADEAFCENFARRYKLSFYTAHFDTLSFARENKYSREEAARILRYREFEKIARTNNYARILTGHNADDDAETFLMNFTSGTGIRGLSGIKPKSGVLVRPLLFASKDDILDYCRENDLAFCIDDSNSDVRFVRNRIRHRIIPELKKINPSFVKTARRNFEILSRTEKIYLQAVEEAKAELTFEKNKRLYIDILKLSEKKSAPTLLFEILYEFGFNPSVVNDAWEARNAVPGKLFYGSKTVLLKDRNYYIVKRDFERFEKTITIPSVGSKNWEEIGWQAEVVSPEKISQTGYKKNRMYLDADKLKFPLIYRAPRSGDKFRPLGMRGIKLLSDYFSDKKMDFFQKEESRVFLSGNKIIGVAGDRISDDFKIGKNTERVLVIRRLCGC